MDFLTWEKVRKNAYGGFMSIIWQLLPFYLVVMLLILLIPVRINLYFLRENKDDFLNIRISTFASLIRFAVEVPIFKQKSPLDLTIEAELKAAEDELIREEKKELSFFDIDWGKVREQLEFFLQNRKQLFFIARFLGRAMTVESFHLSVDGGLGDAAQTGLLSGLYWTMAGTLTNLGQRWLTVRSKPVFRLKPDFRYEPSLVVRLDTTISFRIGHFAVTSLLFLVTKIRGG
jgi:hypothetical protein